MVNPQDLNVVRGELIYNDIREFWNNKLEGVCYASVPAGSQFQLFGSELKDRLHNVSRSCGIVFRKIRLDVSQVFEGRGRPNDAHRLFAASRAG